MVAATVAATLGLVVEQHDDGSQPGMHDLNIMALAELQLQWR